MKGDLKVRGNTFLSAVLQSRGNTSVGGVLNVKGATALASTLQVTGNISSAASVTASSAVLVNGQGNTRIEIRSQNGGTPYIDWINDSTTDYDARLLLVDDNTLRLDGADLLVSGSLTVRKNLAVSGTTTICGALSVSGNTTIKSNLTVCGQLTVSGDLIGPTNWIVPGYATVSKNLNVRQHLATSGNLILGNAGGTTPGLLTSQVPNPGQQFNPAGNSHAAIYFPKISAGTTGTNLNTAFVGYITGQQKRGFGFFANGQRLALIREQKINLDVETHVCGLLMLDTML
jgi:cytoskeletal protein CcmA (bactofilin family)